MTDTKYYKVLNPVDKLIEDLELSPCFLQGDISYKYVYMRDPKNISRVITFNPAVYDNMSDFDGDFSEEYEYSIISDADLSHNITQELKKGNYVDMTYEERNMIFGIPYNIETLKNPTFLTLTQHIFRCAKHKNRTMTTIRFTNNNEGLGEVNSHIEKNPNTLRKIFEELNIHVKLAPIKQEISDHYILYKYADIQEKNNYTY